MSQHTATDRAAQLLAPKFLAVGRIERIKVAAYIAEGRRTLGKRNRC
jgi:hypothetical protein